MDASASETSPASSDNTNSRPALESPQVVRRRRRWPILAAFIAGLVVAAIAGSVLDQRNNSDDDSSVEVTLNVVAAESRTMRTFISYDGTLEVGATETVVSGLSGVVTAAAEPGDVLEAGDTIVRIDDEPVIVMYGEVPMYRALEVDDEGADVKQLEIFLALGGYDDDNLLTVDETFTSATADAVTVWQEELGIEDPDELVDGRFVVVAGPIEVIDVASVGDTVRDGGAIATVAIDETTTATVDDGDARPISTATEAASPVVELSVVADEIDRFEVGQLTEIEAADGSVYPGTVTDVGTVAVNDSPDPNAEPGVPVTIELDPGTEVLAGPAEVRLTDSETVDAIAVPTRALLALAEGGQAVEVASSDSGESRLVGVELGIFADGWVEVLSDTEGGAIQVGTEVVVPS